MFQKNHKHFSTTITHIIIIITTITILYYNQYQQPKNGEEKMKKITHVQFFYTLTHNSIVQL